MDRMVSYLSKPNHEVRDNSGRFEGTFRWRWLASLWATLHPTRQMGLVAVTTPATVASHEQAAGPDVSPAPARRPRRRPSVQRAA